MIFPKMNQKNSALMIIDVINSCADKKFERKNQGVTYDKIRKMIPKLNSFIEEYRKITNKPIIFINTVPWQRKYLPDNINELYEDPDVCFYTKDKSGDGEKFYMVKPEKKDIVFEKNTYDAFTSKKLSNYLKKNKIKYLIITGLFADACVLFTVSGGFAKGYSFVVLEDLIESGDHKQALKKEIIKNIYPDLFAKVLNSEKFIKAYKKL